MQYEIFGTIFPAVTFTLDEGESIYSESGGMGCMNSTVDMQTAGRGGFFKSISRLFQGDSIFTVNYTASADNSVVTIVAKCPGQVVAVELEDTYIIAQQGSFLCGEQTIETSIELNKKLSTGLFGGEGFILQKIEGTGFVFLETAGDLMVHELDEDEVLYVDTGNLVAFDSTVSYEVEMVKGVKNILFGGEGLFLTKMTGPGKVWIQTGCMKALGKAISPYITYPTTSSTTTEQAEESEEE